MLISLQAPRTFLMSKSFLDAHDATLARRVGRLQYLRRLLLHAPAALVVALQAEQATVGSWRPQIPLDLLWVWQVMPGLAHLPCALLQLSDWSDYILLHDEWPGIVRRAADLHRGLVRNQVETRAWLRRFHCKLECIGIRSLKRCCRRPFAALGVWTSYQQMPHIGQLGVASVTWHHYMPAELVVWLVLESSITARPCLII